MKTEDLISKLSSDAQPVKPWKSPAMIALTYAGIAAVLVVLGLLVSGPRTDFSAKSTQSYFWFGLILWSALSFLGLNILFVLATPGAKLSAAFKWSFVTLLVAVSSWHLYLLAGMSDEAMHEGLFSGGARCASVTVLTALLISTLVYRKAARGLNTKPLRSSLLAGCACLAIGGVLINLNCGDDNGMHVVMWHFVVPTVVIGSLAALLAKRLLKS
ncbi:NrsF family protein [Bdellovibrio sp. NC01]|uniref:NrsF family protein n=1 Tax=Bdellovibrio sp. NC01 TaxID=2220073 RepID=UPI00115962A0|nr:NrsF family protein [Bdellovibrio sp. NC01]QDK38414.1 hypothetical protein DOE51_12925 [Bdellovibrio sp. NC01]